MKYSPKEYDTFACRVPHAEKHKAFIDRAATCVASATVFQLLGCAKALENADLDITLSVLQRDKSSSFAPEALAEFASVDKIDERFVSALLEAIRAAYIAGALDVLVLCERGKGSS